MIHMVTSLLSYAAFLVAFVAGFLFLIQERQLKEKQMGLLFHRLPSLERLDHVNGVALGLGFGLLTLGLACGLAGERTILGHWWTGDPKEYLTVLLWSLYLILWVIRVRQSLRGHRVALLSILGFGLVLLTFLGASYVLFSMHPYHPAG